MSLITHGISSRAMVSLKLAEADIVFEELSDAYAVRDIDAVGDFAQDLVIIIHSLV